MNRNNRVANSSRNFVYGIFSQIITLLLKFGVRTVFIIYLGETYLGINGLYGNIITVLSLAECGFGVAMVYSMYKPLAKNDNHKICALMQLYKKIYTVIGLIVLIIGLAITPFLKYIIKESDSIDHLVLYYYMFLGDTVLSYLFFAYKRSILNADQKNYMVSKYTYWLNIGKSAAQVVLIIAFKDFVIYLVTQLVFTLLTNIAISIKVDKEYPFLKSKRKISVEKSEIDRIKKDVKALMLSNIGRVSLNGTDSIIISAFVGVSVVGKYSNYGLITSSLVMVLSQISVAITGSIGNYVASEDESQYYFLFKKIDFMNFWLYGFSMIALIVLFNPFITIWLGKSLLLEQSCAIVIALNFFLEGMLNSLWMFRTTLGLFTQGKWRPIFSAIINLIVSIVLVRFLGILGVLIGTTAARLFVNVWYDPYIIFKYGLKRSVKNYYVSYIIRFMLLVVLTVILLLIRNLLFVNGISIVHFLFLAIIVTIIPNLIFWVVFHKTQEFLYFKNIVKNLCLKIFHIEKRSNN